MDADPPYLNEFDQPLGPEVSGWTARERPPETPMTGRACTVRLFDPATDPEALLEAFAPSGAQLFTYIPIGPFADAEGVTDFHRAFVARGGQVFTILAGDAPAGTSSYMRHDLANGSIEIGAVMFSPRLQRSVAATEAMHLMMTRVFEAGYRRYEWKCHALNAASRAAAERLGFTFEGVFRNAQVMKGRSRDTAWFSITDAEWPAIDRAFKSWLALENFDAEGRQKASLASFREG
ncbi:MAG: GNAT family protein [Maricaulaceae bacterium]|jgi:RimJ/RimL family protein N-acetyltransferase